MSYLQPANQGPCLDFYYFIANTLAVELHQLYTSLIIESPKAPESLRQYACIIVNDNDAPQKQIKIFFDLLSISLYRCGNPPVIELAYAEPDMFEQIELVIEEYFGVRHNSM